MEDSQAKKQKTKHNATPGNSVPSTVDSINLGDNGGSYGSLDRSSGRKAEKARLRKSNSKEARGDAPSSELVNLLVEMKEEKKVVNEKKFEIFEKCYLQEQQCLLQERENANGASKRGRANNVDGYELHAFVASSILSAPPNGNHGKEDVVLFY